jgi:putative acetyltransferase
MTATPVDPTCAGARRLIALSDAYMAGLYPAESNHFDSPESLAQPHVRFLGIHLDGELIACGAVKLLDDDGHYGEIKRVFVLPAHRGKGLAQPEALGLYRALGYVERTSFGPYRPDPLSVFMEKRLEK